MALTFISCYRQSYSIEVSRLFLLLQTTWQGMRLVNEVEWAKVDIGLVAAMHGEL